MKTFNQYVNEETMPFAQTDKGFVGVEDPAVRDNINNLLDGVTAKNFITPYIGLERISKVLANFHISVPKYTFAGGDEGVTAFEINQFGPKIGMTDDGQVKTNESSPYYLYFEYRAADDGMFGVFASVATEEELDDLMSDYEEEEDEDEDEGEEMNEEKMTDAEMMKREKIVKSMKKNMAGFKERYGKDAKNVMYATATKQAMSEEEDSPFEGGKEKSTPNPENRARQLAKMAAKSAKKKAIKKAKGEQIDEVSKKMLGNYLSKRNLEKGRPGKKKAKSQELAIGKMVNNPKYLKVKVPATNEEEDDGWYAHNEIHGSKGVSKSDWKKGVRMNRNGEKVQTKKLDEVSRDTLSRYISKAKTSTRDAYYGSDAKTSGKRKKGIDMALMKKWGDKKYGLPEPKVKATNESSNPARDGMIAAGYKGSNPAEQGSIAAKKDDEARDKKVRAKKLDEVSKKTLASYIKGATHDVATRSAVTRGKARDAEEKKKNKDYMGARKDSEMADKMFKKSWKRREGIAKAADKLAKD